jgi:hypothetical protein
VATAFGNRERVCCGRTSGTAWLNALIASSTSGSGTNTPGAGSFHPNALGQQEFANLINTAY